MAKEAYQAVRRGDMEAFKGFLDRGLPVNYGRGEETPLHWTAHLNKPDIAKLLIERGADVNARSNILFTPLHWASLRGYTEIVRLLLEHKAKPSIEGGISATTGERKQETPLYLTTRAREGGLECATHLIAHGADVNKKNSQGITALHAAIQQRKRDVAKFFLTQNPDVSTVETREQRTPLIEAMGNSYFDIAKELILRGADVNAQESYQGYTPLHYAVLLKQLDLVKLMLSKGADPDVKSNYGRTALNEAQKLGDPEIIRLLLDAISHKK